MTDTVRGWLAMRTVEMMAGTILVRIPPECLCLLAVYPTKKIAREIAGPKVELIEVRVPKPEGTP